jgi:hypothetical protein
MAQAGAGALGPVRPEFAHSDRRQKAPNSKVARPLHTRGEHRQFPTAPLPNVASYGASMQNPHVIAKFYRDKADECLRRAERENSELALRLMYRRLAECYSGFAEAEEKHAAKRSLAGKGV